MSTKRCYYEILEVSREADQSSIKKAYRQMALQYHPDRNPDEPQAEEKFREVGEAYSVLSDPEKRQIYDQFGHEGLSGRMGAEAGGFSSMDDIFGGFQSIFEDFFGGGPRRRARRGRDMQYELSLSFREAVMGCEKQIEFERAVKCSTCKGSRAEPGTQPKTCKQCQGSGRLRVQQGFFTVAQTCPICQGSGQMIETPCKTCHGEGLEVEMAQVDVKIPAGVDTGIRLRVQGEGEAGPEEGLAGDLFVHIQVKEDKNFERDGADLYTRKYIPFTTALFGGEVDIELLDGEAKVKIPKKMQAPHIERLRGQGVADIRTGRKGSLFVEFQIETPKKLSKKAKELLKELDEEIQPKKEGHSFSSIFGFLNS